MKLTAVALTILGALQLFGAVACGIAHGYAPPPVCHLGLPPLRRVLILHAGLVTTYALLTSKAYTQKPVWFVYPDGRAVLQLSAWMLRLVPPLAKHVLLTSGGRPGGADSEVYIYIIL